MSIRDPFQLYENQSFHGLNDREFSSFIPRNAFLS